jgi:hypothetical protein
LEDYIMASAQDFIIVGKDGKRIAIGDAVTDFRGEKLTLSGFSPPRYEGSTGRVDLRNAADEYIGQFYPSVIDAAIVRG